MDTNFENRLTYNGISFLRSNRLSIDEREIHTYHEILFCMNTNAEFLTENQQQQIHGNVLFLIPKENYHFFRLQDSTVFSRLKIYFPADVLDRTPCGCLMTDIRFFENIDGDLLFLLKKLCRILEEPQSQKQGFYAYSTFLALLTELDRSGSVSGAAQATQNTGELSQITRYISEHLSEDLTIAVLAKKMSLSSSGISHLFKKEMGIPVHQYVTQRRMILAQSLLLAGKKPSKIYADCGYKDYSSFYKAYGMFFGHSPSGEHKTKPST